MASGDKHRPLSPKWAYAPCHRPMQAESNESHIEITCYWAKLELARSDILALLRLKWTHKGRPTHVEEITVYDTPEGYQIVSLALQRCAAQGIGLMILSSKDPADFCGC